MFRKLTASLFALALSVSPAFAGTSTLAVTPGSGSTYQVITNGSGNFVGMFGLCDGAAAAQCVAVKAASTAAGAADPALVVAISPNNSVAVTGTFWQTTQPISAASLPLPTGASTAAGLTTINTTLGSPFQAGASIGNTAFTANAGTNLNTSALATAANQPTNAAQASTTSGQTGRLAMGAVTTSPPSYTTGQTDPISLDLVGNIRMNCVTGCSSSSSITGWAGGTLGAMANYGTSPGAVLVPGVNAFITNTNGNGSAVSASSAPVVIASDQAAVATKAASGAIASGAIASGALAAGSISSGAAVSGAFVAGAIADLAHGQGAMAASVPVAIASNQSAEAAWGHGATGAAAPSGATQLGVTASGATGGFMRGETMCDNHTFKHITSATDTLAVQGVASQTVYVCGWRARAAGVATWYLENTASTNANCSSTLTQITGVATEAANTGEVAYNPIWGGLKNTSANGLCINSTGTGGVDVDIWYTQF